jgi:hypothetical protein
VKDKMAVIPHPPYSFNLAPCDFFLFLKVILTLKGHRFDTIEEIQAESQRVLYTLTEKDFQEAFQNGGDGGTGVYMREGTTSRLMAADRPYGESGIFWIHHRIQQYCCVKGRTVYSSRVTEILLSLSFLTGPIKYN